MSKARLSRPPAIEPVAIPRDDYGYEMTGARGGSVRNSEQEPVSPLSPRSEAILLQRQSLMRERVSPLNSPTGAQPAIRSRKPILKRTKPSQMIQSPPRESYPPAHIRNVPPRKPVNDNRLPRKGVAVAQTPMIVNQPSHHSVYMEYSNHSRPRSRSIQAVPDSFLQDFADHAAPGARPRPAARPSRPRSQSVPPQPAGPSQQEYDRRSCAHCGKAQKNSTAEFLSCKICRGVFYCSMPCWENRVCHRSVKCKMCDCTQASSSVDFTSCPRCKQNGREFWYCSDECWDLRNCHVRADQLPPPPPPKTHNLHRQDFRGQQPLFKGSDGQAHDRQFQNVRDIEAQRGKGKRTPYSQRTGCSATVWAVMITFILLCIFVPIIAIVGKKAH